MAGGGDVPNGHPTESLKDAFRTKSQFMGNRWTPLQQPSNRDRLELYALAKQACHGDAKAIVTSAVNSAERYKYLAWKSKAGLSKEEAMESYILEADRQIRVYGSKSPRVPAAVLSPSVPSSSKRNDHSSSSSSTSSSDEDDSVTQEDDGDDDNNDNTEDGNEDHSLPQTPMPTPVPASDGGGRDGNVSHRTNNPNYIVDDRTSSFSSTTSWNSGSGCGIGNSSSNNVPRGLAAIPLLCAAALESRQAYLRRLSSTPPTEGWWERQVPLCVSSYEFHGTRWTWSSLPERFILMIARFVENLSLQHNGGEGGRGSSSRDPWKRIVQSLLWPLHNALLSIWIVVIVYVTVLQCTFRILKLLVWGSRRNPALSLPREWNGKLGLVKNRILELSQRNQALSVRLAGTTLLPLPTIISFVKRRFPHMTVASVLFVLFLASTWWYWFWIMPFLAVAMGWVSLVAGCCFVVVDLAGESS